MTAPRSLVYVPLDEVPSALVNPKDHDEDLIGASIKRFGFLDMPIRDERTGRLIGGHGRRDQLVAMRDAGLDPPEGIVVEDGQWMVPVVTGWRSKDDAEAHAAGIAINRAAEAGGWVDMDLLPLLDEIAALPEGLEGIGFDADYLEHMTIEMTFGPTVLYRGPVPLDSLKPHPRNYHVHPQGQLDHLAGSLQQHGFLRSIIVARDDTILIGHGMCAAAAMIGMRVGPVVRLDVDPDSPEALKMLVVDELAQFAEVDDRQLTELLRDVNQGATDGLFGTGYDEMILANLLMVTRTAAEVSDFNEAAEWVGMPDYEPETAPWKLIISCPDNETRERFLDELGVREHISFTHSNKRTISAWYPVREGPVHDGGLRWDEPGDDEEEDAPDGA